MNKTQEKILSTAKRLFNTKGFDQVTIRMIAQELNMSSGNLNYHFKKREDILEALYLKMAADFDARIADLESQTFSFSFIFSEIKRSMEVMVEYQFFWSDLHNLLRQNTVIQKHFSEAYQKRKMGTHYMFTQLVSLGLMNEPKNNWEFNFIVDQMINLGNTWIYTSNLYSKTILDETYICKKALDLMRIFYPYLTEKGIKEFELML